MQRNSIKIEVTRTKEALAGCDELTGLMSRLAVEDPEGPVGQTQ